MRHEPTGGASATSPALRRKSGTLGTRPTELRFLESSRFLDDLLTAVSKGRNDIDWTVPVEPVLLRLPAHRVAEAAGRAGAAFV
jgi:hypothetical protein